MQVILHTDFLNAFLKIERLELIREFFGEAPIVIPAEVAEEIARAELLTEMLEAKAIQVEVLPSGEAREFEEFGKLGEGEKACLCLALQKEDAILLSNDNKARRVARDLRLKRKDFSRASDQKLSALLALSGTGNCSEGCASSGSSPRWEISPGFIQ